MKLKLLFCTLFALSSQVTTAQQETIDTTEHEMVWSEDLSQKVDEDIRSYMDLTHTQGLALAIVQNGKVLKKSYYGLADVERNIPVSEKSEFWLASISKHITTALILDLEEDGILSREDLVVKYFPHLPPSWQDVQVKHLMSHTSGIVDDRSGSDSSFYKRMEMASPTMEDFESLIQSVKPQTPAGKKYAYSDTGMIILAMLASKAADKPFYRLMQDRIFKPAEMASYLNNPEEEQPDQVAGYTWADWDLKVDQNRKGALTSDHRMYGGAGSLFVTLQDMVNWNQALNENKILSPQTQPLLWESFQLANGEHISSGLGLKRVDFPGGHATGHNGIAGTEYWKFPEHGIDIIILTNHGMNLASFGLVSLVADDLGLLTEIDKSALLSRLGASRATQTPQDTPNGRYSVKGPFPTEMFIEFYQEDQQAYALVQGLLFELIPLESGGFLGYSKATFFPGAPLPTFAVENGKVSWVMGPNQLPLTSISER